MRRSYEEGFLTDKYYREQSVIPIIKHKEHDLTGCVVKNLQHKSKQFTSYFYISKIFCIHLMQHGLLTQFTQYHIWNTYFCLNKTHNTKNTYIQVKYRFKYLSSSEIFLTYTTTTTTIYLQKFNNKQNKYIK